MGGYKITANLTPRLSRLPGAGNPQRAALPAARLAAPGHAPTASTATHPDTPDPCPCCGNTDTTGGGRCRACGPWPPPNNLPIEEVQGYATVCPAAFSAAATAASTVPASPFASAASAADRAVTCADNAAFCCANR
jgi:hypothetical protein